MKIQTTIIMSLFLFTACGGGSSSESGGSHSGGSGGNGAFPVVNLYAQNVMTRTKVGEAKKVDLDSNVILSSNEDDFVITDVTPVNDTVETTCKWSLSEDKKSVIVDSDEVADCIYEYTVEAKSGSSNNSSAHIRVGVGNTYADATLKTISQNVSNTSGAFDINIKQALISASEPTNLDNYTLNPVLVVIGGGQAVVKNKSMGVIEYTPEGSNPNVTIYYSLETTTRDAVKEIKLGALVLSVSESAVNNTIAANDFTFIYYNNGKYDLIDVNQLVRINVANNVSGTLSHEDIQLVDVQVSDATAFSIFDDNAGVDPTHYLEPKETEYSNKTLLFQASKPGTYEIVYTITNHEGNYDNGIIRLTVYNKEDIFSVQDWGIIDLPTCDIPSDSMSRDYNNIHSGSGTYSSLPSGHLDAEDYCQIYHGSDYVKNKKVVQTKFTPPLSEVVANYLNIPHSGSEYNDSVGEDIVTFTYDEAVNYCASINARLPTRSELMQLTLLLDRNLTPQGDVTDEEWPSSNSKDSSIRYWSMDKASSTTAYTKQLVKTGSGDNVVDNVFSSTSTNAMLSTSCVLYTGPDLEEPTAEWAPVKPYTVENVYTPDPKIGIKYKIDSDITDPHGVLAPYQQLGYTLQDKAGHFAERDGSGNIIKSTSALNIADANGHITDYYYDDTYQKAIILVHLGLQDVDTITIDPGLNDLFAMNWSEWYQSGNVNQSPGGYCYDEGQGRPDYCWKRLSYDDALGSGDAGPFDVHGPSYSLHDPNRVVKEGLPIWIEPRPNGSSSPSGDHLGVGQSAIRIVNQYTRPYYGEDFMMRIKVVQTEEIPPTEGRFIISLHQPNYPTQNIHEGRSLYADAKSGNINNGGDYNGYYYGAVPGWRPSQVTPRPDHTVGILCEGPNASGSMVNHQGRQLSFVYDYLYEYFAVRDGCRNEFEGPDMLSYTSLRGLRQQYAYFWIRYTNDPTTATNGLGPKSHDGRIQVYVSSTAVRPDEPVVDIKGNIGWSKTNMSIGDMGGISGTDPVTGEVYTDFPYYLIIGARVQFNPQSDRANTTYMEELNILTWDKEDMYD